jgi:uncharacterized protein YkwD
MRLAHYLVPRHTNNYKAKLLHNSSIFVLCLSLLFAQLVITGINSVSKETAILGYASQISKSEVIRLTNVKRAEAGLPPLTENPNLDNGAQMKGAHMLSMGYWAHVAPDGTQPWKFFGDVGYDYRYAGENLARDFSSAQAAVDAWMASPSHRDNMLSSKYSEIGIGVVEGNLNGVDSTIIVQFFGQPLVAAAATDQTAASSAVLETIPEPIPEIEVVPTVQETAPKSGTEFAPQTQVAGSDQKVSPFDITKAISMAIVAGLFMIFVIDLIVVSRQKITRIGGKSLAHLSFLGMTLGIILIIQAGRIL